MSYSAAKINNYPAEAMQVIAITGTNGKTTVSHFYRSATTCTT